MKLKFAMFDVDKTLISGDSMFDLLFYTWRKYPASIVPSCFNILLGTFKYIFTGLKDIRLMKNGIFYIVKYLNEDDIYVFTKEILLKKRFYTDALDELNRKKEEGYFNLLVSASPELYLKYFSEMIPADHIIGTIIDEKGKIVGGNCKSHEKVKRINAWLKENSFEIDYENSYGYSDSISADAPMLSLVKNKFLVNSNKTIDGFTNVNWR